MIHPYTVPAEQIRQQIALLRQLPGARDLPIEVTEFGHKDPAQAPSHLVKNYCQMALSGVTQVIWYLLEPRGDGLTPLMDQDGQPTVVGQAYHLVSKEFVGKSVVDFAPDPFTYACLFDDDRLVIWGAPRRVTLAHADLHAVDLAGGPLDPNTLTLSREVPLVILSRGAPISLGSTLILGAQQVIADSVDQFAYPGAGGADPFKRFIRQGGQEYALETRPGQKRNGVPWTPYLGTDRDGTVRAAANWVLPTAWGRGRWKSSVIIRCPKLCGQHVGQRFCRRVKALMVLCWGYFAMISGCKPVRWPMHRPWCWGLLIWNPAMSLRSVSGRVSRRMAMPAAFA